MRIGSQSSLVGSRSARISRFCQSGLSPSSWAQAFWMMKPAHAQDARQPSEPNGPAIVLHVQHIVLKTEHSVKRCII